VLINLPPSPPFGVKCGGRGTRLIYPPGPYHSDAIVNLHLLRTWASYMASTNRL